MCNSGGNTHEETIDCSICHRAGRGDVCLRTALTEKQVEGVETTIKAIGCTVEETDITTKGDGYKADDVECKDGRYDLLLDKDFKITKKDKED